LVEAPHQRRIPQTLRRTVFHGLLQLIHQITKKSISVVVDVIYRSKGMNPVVRSSCQESTADTILITGDPNTEGLPQWPAYDLENRSTMVFDTESHVLKKPYEKIRQILIQ